MTKNASRDGVRSNRRVDKPLIVTKRGKIARLESSLTPHEAQIEDLVFLRKVLTKGDIPFLLIRDHKTARSSRSPSSCVQRSSAS